MTVTADAKQRIRLRAARAGDRFDVQVVSKDQFVLTRLRLARSGVAKATVGKVQGYTVARVDHPVTDEAIREALREFP